MERQIMERLQTITKVKCPAHNECLRVVVDILDDGSLDIWKGCPYCEGRSTGAACAIGETSRHTKMKAEIIDISDEKSPSLNLAL
jgi:hypothetical protein